MSKNPLLNKANNNLAEKELTCEVIILVAKYLYTRVATRGGAYIDSCGTWGNFKIHETILADGPAGDKPATLRD